RAQLRLFTGNTGGIDSWLSSDRQDAVYARLDQLPAEPVSLGQLNQLLALSHQPEVSPGFFKYYWLSTPKHTYDVTFVPRYHDSYRSVDQILSLDQMYWGLYRIYCDSLLYFGSIRDGYFAFRSMKYSELQDLFEGMRYDSDALVHRGPVLPLEPIAQDDRYLI